MSEYQSFKYQPPDMPSYAPNSTLAVISLVAGILGLSFLPLVGSIVALITAPMAKREIAESNATLGGENLAQIGLILGWVGIGFSLLVCCLVVAALGLPAILAGLIVFAEGVGWIIPAVLSIG